MRVKLEEIVDLQNGYAFKSKDYVNYSNTLVCRMSNIKPNKGFDINYNPKYLADEEVEKYEKYILKDDDIIIAMTDLANDPKILGVPVLVSTEGKVILQNQRVGKLVIKNDNIYPAFLMRALSTKRARSFYKKFSNGGLQINIGKKEILENSIILPPLTQQKTIAKTLDKAKELIELRKTSIEKLDELSKSVFIDMFGNPVENPMGYPIMELSKLLTDKASNGYFGSKTDYNEDGTPTIWIGDFIDTYSINIDALKRVHIPEKKKEKYLLKYGDILFCRSSLTKEGIAKVGFIAKDVNQEVIFEDHVIKTPLNIDKVLPEYFYFYSYNQFYRLWMYKMSKTATMTTIGQKEILKSPIIVPPLDLQNKFAKTIQKIESQKALYEKELVKLEENFEALLAKIFG